MIYMDNLEDYRDMSKQAYKDNDSRENVRDWRKIGGSIYMNITTALTHTGSVDYKGNLFCSLLGKLENHDEKKEEESKDVVIDLSMKP